MARRGENIYKRKDGRWEGRYKSGYTDDGKTKYRSVYGRSYAEVRQKLVPLKVAVPTLIVACKLTVLELFDEWLSAVKLRVKPSTFANYQMKVEKHILPEYGGMRYDLLTVQMLNRYIEEKLVRDYQQSTFPILSSSSNLWLSMFQRYTDSAIYWQM